MVEKSFDRCLEVGAVKHWDMIAVEKSFHHHVHIPHYFFIREVNYTLFQIVVGLYANFLITIAIFIIIEIFLFPHSLLLVRKFDIRVC